METPPVRKSLQLVAAPEIELHLGHGSDQLAHDLGNENLSALGLPGDARRDVDRRTEDVTAFLDHLAGVEADADAKLPFRIELAVVGDRLLDVQRALDAVPGGAEADHEAVAEALDPPARVLGDLVLDDRLVRLHDLVRGGEAPGGQEARRLLDVREHDRDRALGLADREAADDRLRGERRGGVDRLTESLGDLAQKSLRGTEACFTLRVAHRLQQP